MMSSAALKCLEDYQATEFSNVHELIASSLALEEFGCENALNLRKEGTTVMIRCRIMRMYIVQFGQNYILKPTTIRNPRINRVC
jgi:hypothetical protein